MASTSRVLVVEDEPAIRGLLALLLDGEGYSVDSASDGEEAFAKVQHHRPDALIVDLDLPIMKAAISYVPAVPTRRVATSRSSPSRLCTVDAW